MTLPRGIWSSCYPTSASPPGIEFSADMDLSRAYPPAKQAMANSGTVANSGGVANPTEPKGERGTREKEKVSLHVWGVDFRQLRQTSVVWRHFGPQYAETKEQADTSRPLVESTAPDYCNLFTLYRFNLLLWDSAL